MLLAAALICPGALLHPRHAPLHRRSPQQQLNRVPVCRMEEEIDAKKAAGAPSFDQFKKMMADVTKERPEEELSVGEKVQRGVSKTWVNPAYWNRQFVTASHVANNVPNGSAVIELGKDAKNLYYLNSPGSATLIVPPSNQKVEEGPIREAAAKLNMPFQLFTDRALDDLSIQPASFDAALCMDMLDGAPENVAAGAVVVLANSLKPGGRFLFLERESVGMPKLVREYGGCTVEVDSEGGYDVGIATRNKAPPKPSRKASAAKSKASKGPPPPATTAGFGGAAGAMREKKAFKPKVKKTAEEKAAERRVVEEAAARAQAQQEAAAQAAAAEEAAAEAAAAAKAEAQRVAAAEAAAQKMAAEQAEAAARQQARDEEIAKAQAELAAAEAEAKEAAAKIAEAEAAKAEQEEWAAAQKAAEERAAEVAAAEKAIAAAAAAEAEQAAAATAAAAAAAAAAAPAAPAAAAAAAQSAPPSVESEVRRLIRKEVVGGEALSEEEDRWLEAQWEQNQDLCDQIDREVEEEAEKGVAAPVAAVPPPPAAKAPPPPAAASAAATSSDAAAAAPAGGGGAKSVKERLLDLKELLDAGFLTEEEYAAKRAAIVANL